MKKFKKQRCVCLLMVETYIVGAKIKSVGSEQRSRPLPKEEAIPGYITMKESPDYCDAVLYRQNGKKKKKLEESEIDKLIEKIEAEKKLNSEE